MDGVSFLTDGFGPTIAMHLVGQMFGVTAPAQAELASIESRGESKVESETEPKPEVVVLN